MKHSFLAGFLLLVATSVFAGGQSTPNGQPASLKVSQDATIVWMSSGDIAVFDFVTDPATGVRTQVVNHVKSLTQLYATEQNSDLQRAVFRPLR